MTVVKCVLTDDGCVVSITDVHRPMCWSIARWASVDRHRR